MFAFVRSVVVLSARRSWKWEGGGKKARGRGGGGGERGEGASGEAGRGFMPRPELVRCRTSCVDVCPAAAAARLAQRWTLVGFVYCV